MDNKCPQIVRDYLINSKKIQLLLVPLYMHRVSIVEIAIHSFKNYFISSLATINLDFLLHLWCRLLSLTTITINLLQPSQINLCLSTEEYLNRVLNYNKIPIVLPGYKTVVHKARTKRGIQSSHAIDIWYIGTALYHYRYHKITA